MTVRRLSIFPLAGALIFPRALLPLHIFEPRYRAMISEALARDQRIGMIQPRDQADPPGLYDIGCIGRIINIEALPDGRFNVVLSGLSRFRMLRELEVATPYRQIDADTSEWDDAAEAPALASVRRAELEREARRFADSRGYRLDWEAIGRLDDEALTNGIAQIAPFDVAAKQMLLEAVTVEERADLLVQLLQFFRLRDGDDDDERPVLQ